MSINSFKGNKYLKTGIALAVTGSSFICISLPILIYDLAGYGPIMEEKKNHYLDTNQNYNEYNTAIQHFYRLVCTKYELYQYWSNYDSSGNTVINH